MRKILITLIFNVVAIGLIYGFGPVNHSDTLKIIAFGNSITAERSTIDKVFAQRLPELLKSRGVTTKVINAGIPGSHTGSISDNNRFKIKHGRDRFESEVLALQPDLVIIGFGTNDSYIDTKVKGGKSRISLSDYKSNLEYFIVKLGSIDTKVILIAPNILGSKYPDFQNKRLLKYVKTVRKLAKKYKTGLVDNFKLFQDYQKSTGQSFDELMLDGIHPNDKGHQLISEALVEIIISVD